jgi:hypothetical protein
LTMKSNQRNHKGSEAVGAVRSGKGLLVPCKTDLVGKDS